MTVLEDTNPRHPRGPRPRRNRLNIHKRFKCKSRNIRAYSRASSDAELEQLLDATLAFWRRWRARVNPKKSELLCWNSGGKNDGLVPTHTRVLRSSAPWGCRWVRMTRCSMRVVRVSRRPPTCCSAMGVISRPLLTARTNYVVMMDVVRMLQVPH